MAANLKEVRERIRSVNSTQQITKAMKMVAASRLKKAKTAVEISRPYANKIKEAGLESKFKGKNFVFDERLGEKITEDIIAKCHQCGKPADTHTNCKNDACHLLFIQCEDCTKSFDGCCTTECKEVYHLPLEEQEKLRAGNKNGIMVFNKSKQRLRPSLGVDIEVK